MCSLRPSVTSQGEAPANRRGPIHVFKKVCPGGRRDKLNMAAPSDRTRAAPRYQRLPAYRFRGTWQWAPSLACFLDHWVSGNGRNRFLLDNEFCVADVLTDVGWPKPIDASIPAQAHGLKDQMPIS